MTDGEACGFVVFCAFVFGMISLGIYGLLWWALPHFGLQEPYWLQSAITGIGMMTGIGVAIWMIER